LTIGISTGQAAHPSSRTWTDVHTRVPWTFNTTIRPVPWTLDLLSRNLAGMSSDHWATRLRPGRDVRAESTHPSEDISDKTETALHQAFGSPSKPVFPGLREPASSQTHLFSSTTANPVSSSPTKPTPFSRSSYSLFATPRKLDNDLASSGGETPKSPEHAGTDTDATPDNSLNFRSAAVKFSNNTATAPSFTAGDKPVSPVKEKRRDSWFRRLLPSPGRGEVARGGTYTDKAVKRVRKQRKNRALTRVRRDSISDSEASDVVMASSPRKTSSGGGRGQGDENDTKQDDGRKGPHWMYTFFDFLSTHPTLPHILSWYVQLALNAFLFTLFGYVVWTFWSAIRSDVDMKSEEAVKALMTEMEDCARNYLTNRCARDSRMPALEALCNNWDKCMNRDPNVGRAKVSAHTFAEIFNSFLEPISYKTMVSFSFNPADFGGSSPLSFLLARCIQLTRRIPDLHNHPHLRLHHAGQPPFQDGPTSSRAGCGQSPPLLRQ